MINYILDFITRILFRIKIRNQYKKRKKELQQKDPYLYK